MNEKKENLIKGRGAQYNSKNPFLINEYSIEHIEGIDIEPETSSRTKFYFEYPKKIINKVTSLDLRMEYSMNPYQGCEHGCIYCYARNTHQYWGFSAGMDFEKKIIVKPDAPEILKNQLSNPKWNASPIMFSGNTDCYQPAEKKFQLTRKMLKVLLKFRHPVGLITKNSLILRDLDIIQELNKYNLVSVNLSITTLDEMVRRKLEPRTASSVKRLKVVEALSKNGIPVNILIAPIIPGLTSHEIPEILKATADAGALSSSYTIIRLNGSIGEIFCNWVHKAFPERANKIIHQIEDCHGGVLNDSRFGKRMRGEGNVALQIKRLFEINKRKFFKNRKMPKLDSTLFEIPSDQMRLF